MKKTKFWKFISKKKFLNKSLIERDKRLLKNFYLDNGYYDVAVTSYNVDYFDDQTFKLSYKIDAGEKYIVNSTNLDITSRL